INKLCAVLSDQLVAEALPTVETCGVQTWQEQVASGDQFQLALLDEPFLLADFDAASESFAMNAGPVEGNPSRGGLVRGPDQAAIGHGNSHQVAQAIFSTIELSEGRFDLRAEQEVLRSRFGFAIGATAP